MRITPPHATTTRKRSNPILGRRFSRLSLAAALGIGLALGLVAGLSAPSALAATAPVSKHVPKLRTVEGMVKDKSGDPVHGAVVYLQDTKSLAVRSYLSDAQGRFHFRELSMDADFDLWAELQGKRSKTRGISHFNSKNDLDYTLKVDTAK